MAKQLVRLTMSVEYEVDDFETERKEVMKPRTPWGIFRRRCDENPGAQFRLRYLHRGIPPGSQFRNAQFINIKAHRVEMFAELDG